MCMLPIPVAYMKAILTLFIKSNRPITGYHVDHISSQLKVLLSTTDDLYRIWFVQLTLQMENRRSSHKRNKYPIDD